YGIVYLGHLFENFDHLINQSTLSFSGTNIIPCTMYNCTAPRGLMNFSQNPSFHVENTGSSTNEITTQDPETYITTVALYDEDYEMLGVAKVAKPVLNTEDLSVSFRLKLNY